MGGLVAVSYTCREICAQIEAFAPPRFALEGDPIGLQLGCGSRRVERIFLVLELTPEAAREAMDFRPDMLFVHHTPFFKPFRQLLDDAGHDRIVLELIRKEIALYTAHTNLDCVRGGVNDVLADLLGIEDARILQPLNQNTASAGLGRIGPLKEPESLGAFAGRVAERLGNNGLRYCGDKACRIETVACCGGTGAFLMAEAKARGADAFVTADIKHHEGVAALEMGLALIDAGHFATENPVIPVLAAYLKEKMPSLEVGLSSVCGSPFSTVG